MPAKPETPSWALWPPPSHIPIVPIIGMWDGGGQRAHDGVSGLAGTGELLDRLVQCSGRVPIISLVLGPVVGVSSLAASLADFTILGEEHGQLFCG